MQLFSENRGRTLYIKLIGEIDEHNAIRARLETDALAEKSVGRVDRAVFDLGGISFMDSTGIGFMIGRYKKYARYGLPVYVTNLSSNIDRILLMSGVYTVIPKI